MNEVKKALLYELPRRSKLTLEALNDSGEVEEFEATLNNIDGMYSNITDDEGRVIHLAAFTPMRSFDDGETWEVDLREGGSDG